MKKLIFFVSIVYTLLLGCTVDQTQKRDAFTTIVEAIDKGKIRIMTCNSKVIMSY